MLDEVERRRWPGVVSRLAVALAVSGVTAKAGLAQERCPAEPTLVAVSGGGWIGLSTEGSSRIPYGVAYRFVHQVRGARAVLVAITVEGDSAGAPISAPRRAPGTDCFELLLKAFPQDRSVTITEQRAMPATAEERRVLEASLAQMRDDLIPRLLGGSSRAPWRRGRSRPP